MTGAINSYHDGYHDNVVPHHGLPRVTEPRISNENAVIFYSELCKNLSRFQHFFFDNILMEIPVFVTKRCGNCTKNSTKVAFQNFVGFTPKSKLVGCEKLRKVNKKNTRKCINNESWFLRFSTIFPRRNQVDFSENDNSKKQTTLRLF